MESKQLPIEWQQLIIAAQRLNFGKMTITFAHGKPTAAKAPLEKDFKFGQANSNDFKDSLDSIPLG